MNGCCYIIKVKFSSGYLKCVNRSCVMAKIFKHKIFVHTSIDSREKKDVKILIVFFGSQPCI